MAVLELCLLSWLATLAPTPQAPPTPATTSTITDEPPAWLPPGTLFAIGVHVGADTDLQRLWHDVQQLAPTAGIGDGPDLPRLLAAAGLSVQDLEGIARGGIAFGITGLSTTGVEFVCVADLRHARASLRTALPEILRRAAGERAGQSAQIGEFLVLASTAENLAAASAALTANAPAGLTTTTAYLAAAARTPATVPPLLTVFVRPAALAAAVVDCIPGRDGEVAARIVTATGLPALEHAMLRVGAGGGGIEAAASCTLPAAQSPLACLFGGGPALAPALAATVPAAALGFSFSSCDLRGFLQRTLDLVAADADAGAALGATLAQLDQQLGLDLRRDVLAAFSGLAVDIAMPHGHGALLGLADGTAFAATLDRLLQAAALPVERGDTAGATSYRLQVPGMPVPFAFGVVGDWLCLAGGEETLQVIAQQIRGATADPEAQALLADAGPGTTMLFASADGRSHGGASCQPDHARFAGHWSPRGPEAIAAAAPTPADQPAPAELVLALHDAEHGSATNLQGLVRLTAAEHAGVAARATWLLGQRKEREALPVLAELATTNPHAAVRIQAMHALLRAGFGAEAATAALDDDDPRVRTLAAQLLGRLQQPAAAAVLLAALTGRAPTAASDLPATDLQAMLLALVDLQCQDQLLPAAEALNGCAARDVGPSLAFYFQTLSPKLAPAAETTLLLAVLDHSEPLLRRYAISRLGELRQPAAANAIEDRLAKEGPELRPLLEVALAHVRQQQQGAAAATEAAPVAADGTFWQRITTRWQQLPGEHRLVLYGIGGISFLAAAGLIVALLRRRNARREVDTLSLVAPSQDYLDQREYEAEEDLATAADRMLESAEDAPEDADYDGYATGQEGDDADAPAEWPADADGEPFDEAEDPDCADATGEQSNRGGARRSR